MFLQSIFTNINLEIKKNHFHNRILKHLKLIILIRLILFGVLFCDNITNSNFKNLNYVNLIVGFKRHDNLNNCNP